MSSHKEMTRMAFPYLGYRDCESICDITISRGETPVVVFHEREDNQGTSVTNMSEYLATQILQDYLPGYKASEVHWFEHYSAQQSYLNPFQETWDEITYNEKNGKCYDPKWRTSTKEAVEELIKLNETNNEKQ